MLPAVVDLEFLSADVCIPNNHAIDESHDCLLQGLWARKLIIELQTVLEFCPLMIDFPELAAVQPDASTLIANVDLNRSFRIVNSSQRNKAFRTDAICGFGIFGDVQFFQRAGKNGCQFFAIEPAAFAARTDVHLRGVITECSNLEFYFSALWAVWCRSAGHGYFFSESAGRMSLNHLCFGRSNQFCAKIELMSDVGHKRRYSVLTSSERFATESPAGFGVPPVCLESLRPDYLLSVAARRSPLLLFHSADCGTGEGSGESAHHCRTAFRCGN